MVKRIMEESPEIEASESGRFSYNGAYSKKRLRDPDVVLLRIDDSEFTLDIGDLIELRELTARAYELLEGP